MISSRKQSWSLLLTLGCTLLACGNSGEDFEPWVLDELTAEEGISLRVPEFEVMPGRESQNCYFVRVPDLAAGDDLWIDRVVIAMNPGSHHMNVFRVKTIGRLDPADGVPVTISGLPATFIEGGDDWQTHPCWDSSAWADWPLVANLQESTVEEPISTWQLPETAAIRLTPGELLMIQTHYVNTTDQPTLFGARVGLNFYRYTRSAPAVELGSLFATQQSLRVCRSRPNPVYSGTCRFPNAVTITAANGHFHSRGERFSIYPWDGSSTQHPDAATMFYESKDWSHPPMTTDIGVAAPANTGIWWDCQYKWREPTESTCAEVDAKDPEQMNDCCYTFGGITDVGEHCNVFLYYYPKVNTDIFCL